MIDVFLAVEDEGEGGLAFADFEVAGEDSAVVVVGGLEFDLVAFGIDLDVVVIELLQFLVGDIESSFEPLLGRGEVCGCEQAQE